MADSPRIEDLRRRIQQDPAAIAFAQLAEEHRRNGDLQEAVRLCRAGLEQHPGYLSARVTLGRALMELRSFDEAQAQFEHVLIVAPDNLIALRSMAELHESRSETPPLEPPGPYPDALMTFDTAVAEFNTVVRAQTEEAILRELEGWLTAILADRSGSDQQDPPS